MLKVAENIQARGPAEIAGSQKRRIECQKTKLQRIKLEEQKKETEADVHSKEKCERRN